MKHTGSKSIFPHTQSLEKERLWHGEYIYLSVTNPQKWLIEFDPFGPETFAKSKRATWFNHFIPLTCAGRQQEVSRLGQGMSWECMLSCWTKDLVHMLYGPKNAEAWGSPRRLFWCTHSVNWNGWGAIFEHDIQIPLMHLCDVHGSQCNAQKKWRSCSHIASYPFLGLLFLYTESLNLIKSSQIQYLPTFERYFEFWIKNLNTAV